MTVCAVAVLLLAAGGAPAPAAARPNQLPPPTTVPTPPPVTPDGADPGLTGPLDAIFATVPSSSCLSVSVGGRSLYARNGDLPVVPASTLKLLTATVAVDKLGADHTFETRVVAPAPVAAGTVVGDLTLVGGGDPLLATDVARVIRRLDDTLHPTSLDQLADGVAAAGIRHITGGIIGDESRYDTVRSVPTWPGRYVTQEQSGPLSALSVDDGYTWELRPDQPPRRIRTADPALAAALTFTALLQQRGIQVDGAPRIGVAPPGPTVASVRSAPLRDVVAELLTTSDNQTAELLTKELGHQAGRGGTTAAGIGVLADTATSLGLAGPTSVTADGSGLDPSDRVTCDELVRVLDHAGGPDSLIGRGLPIAAETGTLRTRFQGTPVAGKLRAKTGRLNGVSSLAGYVPLASGEVATFSFVANDSSDESAAHDAQALVAQLLVEYRLPCPPEPEAPIVIPAAFYASPVGTLAMFPLQTVVLPGTVIPLQVFEERYQSLVDRCLAADEDFGVVLISHGSEVGGGDRRTDVGTRMAILRHEALDDGRRLLLAGGRDRLRVRSWLPDDPYPRADIADWPDVVPAGFAAEDRLAATAASLRAVLAAKAALGDDVPTTAIDLAADDPVAASYRLAQLAPITTFDRQQLLAAPSVEERLDRLDRLLADEALVARARRRT